MGVVARMMYKSGAKRTSARYLGWSLPFFVFLVAAGAAYILPWIPGCAQCGRRCHKDRQGELYEDILTLRSMGGLIASYEPRQHQRYQSAYKLMDIAARHDSSSDTSTGTTMSDIEEEDENEEWAP